jgi:preprotein translocase subunit SecD
LQFGTGPIKGFAVTLCVGILTSVFSALVVTRLLFHLYPGERAEALSI